MRVIRARVHALTRGERTADKSLDWARKGLTDLERVGGCGPVTAAPISSPFVVAQIALLFHEASTSPAWGNDGQVSPIPVSILVSRESSHRSRSRDNAGTILRAYADPRRDSLPPPPIPSTTLSLSRSLLSVDLLRRALRTSRLQ